MNIRYICSVMILMVTIVGCSMSVQHQLQADDKISLERFRTLAGQWETVPGAGEEKERVSYRVTSGGSAVEEILFPGTQHEMLSIYREQNGNVAMTHYCMVGNQPEFRAESKGPHDLLFRFVGGTNLDPAKDMHIHELRIKFRDPNHIRQEWVGYQNGKEKEVKVLELKRVG